MGLDQGVDVGLGGVVFDALFQVPQTGLDLAQFQVTVQRVIQRRLLQRRRVLRHIGQNDAFRQVDATKIFKTSRFAATTAP